MISRAGNALRRSAAPHYRTKKFLSVLRPNVHRSESYWLPFAAAGTTFVLVGVLKLVKQNMITTEINNEILEVSKELSEIIRNDLDKHSTHSIAPTLVRLAWHSAGTYSRFDRSGGSNGATMRFAPECDWKANAGLETARNFLEDVKANHPNVSYSDIWTLAGKIAIEEMGGPQIPWRRGRRDKQASECIAEEQTDAGSPSCPRVPASVVSENRLPTADSGSAERDVANMKSVFGRIGGLSHKEMVALLGAHAVGRCHTEASGYWGPWTNAETTFSNEYFRLLLEEKWTLKKKHEGKKWTGPRQYENSDGTLMMLPSDMALLEDPSLREFVELFAQDENEFFKTFAEAYGKLLENGVELTTEKPGAASNFLGVSF